MDFLHRFMPHFETVRPRWREALRQIKAVTANAPINNPS
jgi:hypothetical protein